MSHQVSARACLVTSVLCLGVGILAGMFFPALMVAPAMAPTTRDTSSDVEFNWEGWQTYQDDSNGFILNRPDGWSQVQPQEPYGVLSAPAVAFTTDYADYNPTNYSQSSWFVVSAEKTTDDACFAVNDNFSSAFNHEQLVWDVPFRVLRSDDAGAGNRYEQTLYRTYRNGRCYEIATTLHTASDWSDLDMNAVKASQAAARLELERAVESFHFIDE